MPYFKRSLLFAGLIILFSATVSVFAQGVGSSGSVKGTVTDPQGAVVSGATVSLVGAENGFKRTTQTDPNGDYQFINVPPGTYDMTVEGKGFGTFTTKSVPVSVGQAYIGDVQLKVAATDVTVDVTSDMAVVDTTQAQQATMISGRLIQDLPINRRDYLTFSLLSPAVSDSTRLAADQDFRVKQTPQSGLSFYGSNGRGNSVTVDGGETNDDSGGVRGNLSQDAVQEFQINRSNYNAELGGASGATINIVSKSGTNIVHGSAFGFFRNNRLDARNPFSFSQALAPAQVFNPATADLSGSPVKDKLSRQQYGGSLGLPLLKDEAFIFGSFENLRQNAQNSVPILTSTSIFRPTGAQTTIINQLATLAGNPPVPCLTGQPALPAATCATILNNVLTLNPASSALSAYAINLFENNGGLFNYQTHATQASFRFDERFKERDQIFLRYNYSQDTENNPDVQSLIGFSRGSSTFGRYHTIAGAWFHNFSANVTNEFRGQYNRTNFNVTPNVLGQVGIDIPGFGNFGNQIFIPNFSVLSRPEIADNLTMVHGNHTFKFGFSELVRGNKTDSWTFFPGRFVFGSLPGGLLSPCLQVPAACGLTAGATTINPLQSFSLGLPQFYQQGFGSPSYNVGRPFTAAFAQDSWNVRPNLTLNFGVRYELDSQKGIMHTDSNNFGPRVSFSWDPFKDHRTVIRGGYGIFYSQIYAQIPNVIQTLGNNNNTRQIANLLIPLTGAPGLPSSITSALIFQTLFAQGRVQCSSPPAGSFACIRPSDLTQFGITVTNSGALPPLTVLFAGQADYQNPMSQQLEFGFEREFFRGMSLGGSYIRVRTTHLPIAIDTNLKAAPLVTDPVTGASIRQWSTSAGFPCSGAGIFNCFVDPTILQNNVYSSIGRANYDGIIIEAKERFSQYVSIMTNYTWSRAHDDVTDFNSDFSPMDQTNLAGEYSLSDFDQRHKFVFAGVLETHLKGSGGAAKFFSGFQFSPIVRYNSPHPFNLLAGTNVNNDRHSTNDRPAGAARNTGIGPNYFDVDLRIAKRITFAERAHLDVIADGFNILNRTNYASVNNVVGNIAGPYNLKGVVGRSPSQPLGFTSAFPKRQVQIGVRLTF
ncbi:MAG: TonB-dependent receptor [Acidobacteria bacterium]|nr:TonB-dependent receptor [Acidobacteriota bacterium]